MRARYRIIFLLVFFISGFSGLIYESIWAQYLKLFLGHAAYAQTLVLVIFMGGMAIGSYITSRYSTKWTNLFKIYAIVEGIIGILAIIFHESFTSFLDLSYDSVLTNLETPFTINLYKWVSASALILPQSILLGTTFPLMSAAILRTFPTSPGKNISLLYFTNSLGAAIGVLFSGFVFIKAFGLPGTIRLAGIINIVIAVIVLYLISKSSEKTGQPIKASKEQSKITGKKSSSTTALLAIAAFTGMASFIYEIGWIRMLNMVMGTSNHAFELMLSAFILGLAFGGFWIRKRMDKMSNQILFLGYVQIIMGILAMSTLMLYGNTFNLMHWILESVNKDDMGYFIFNLSSNGIALLIMFPTTFCAGMTLPLITTILLKVKGERSIGSVYAWNTIGGITGVILAVHIGMPYLGLKGMISFGAGIDILLGIILFFVIGKSKYKFKYRIGLATGALIILFYIGFYFNLDQLKMSSAVYRGYSLLNESENEVLFHEDGKTASISIIKGDKYGGTISLKTNGKSDATIYINEHEIGRIDESTMYQSAIIPMALNPEAKIVANIGLGSGITTKTFLDNPNIQSIHTIEIEQEIVNAAKQFDSRLSPVFSDPRSKIVIDDAKSYFASGKLKYDIIVSEPSNPWISGISGLFSTEFYHIIRKHLNDDGIFAQWIHFYNIDETLVASVLKSISQSFNDYEVYLLNSSECLIVAKKEGSLQPLDNTIISLPKISKSLKYIQVNSIQDIQYRFLGNKKILDPFIESFSIPANSDYYPVLDQNATKARFLGLSAENIYGFTHHYHPVVSLLSGKNPSWDSSDITLSYFFNKSKEAHDAMELYDFFVKDKDFNYSLLSEKIRMEAKLTKRLFKTKMEHGATQARLPMLYKTSVRMTPYLTSKEMDNVWKSLGINENTLISKEEQTWLSLFKAISHRNAIGIISASETLLSDYVQGLPANAKEYIISAAIIGYIIQDRLDEAQVLWWQNKENILNNPKSEMLFQFLYANSKNR